MINSLRSLLDAPYNKAHLSFAYYRFILWKLIRFFRLQNYKMTIWKDRKVLIHYDSVQSMWLMYNYWVDWEEFHLIKDSFKEDAVALDIGSNIGLYSLWMSKFIKKGTIHSFEPDKRNFERLQNNIALNNLSGIVRLNKAGVSNKTGVVYLSQHADVLNHIVYDKTPDAVEISTVTLDEYANKNGIRRINYLKIDIEGFEMLAFRGGENLLKNGQIDVIQLEINSALSNSGVTEQQLVSYLESFGYYLAYYDINNKKLQKIAYTKDRENYFAVREQ